MGWRAGWAWVFQSGRAVGEAFGRGTGALCRSITQQMAAANEQVGQRAGHQQAMGVLVEAATAQLGKAEDSLDDGDRMLDPGPTFDLVRFFARSIRSTMPRWRIAAIGKALGACCRITARWPR